jgi:hypothetical protein
MKSWDLTSSLLGVACSFSRVATMWLSLRFRELSLELLLDDEKKVERLILFRALEG